MHRFKEWYYIQNVLPKMKYDIETKYIFLSYGLNVLFFKLGNVCFSSQMIQHFHKGLFSCLMPLNQTHYPWQYDFRIAVSSQSSVWSHSTLDVRRKETLIILLVASVLLLPDLWQRANPEVATTCGEKFPNILMLARLKAYSRFVLDQHFGLVKQTENEGKMSR